jgi:BirA family biotin operon repressor/biotin-[acetyl-CoA-carboxylase] ligase
LFLTGCFFNAKIIPGQLSIIIGVLLANILKSCLPKANIGLKWPNDLLIDGKKCGGILIEISDQIYIGIGINISSHPSNTSMPATHLEIYEPINTNWLVREITNAISAELLSIKDFSIYQKLWWSFAKDFIPFWKVNINGEILGIDTNGQLLIKESDGNIISRHQTFT